MTTRKLGQTTMVTALGMLFGLSLAACGSGDMTVEEDVGSIDSQLYSAGTSFHWPRDSNHGGTGIGADIHVCYDPALVSNADMNTAIQAANNVVTWAQTTWGAVADINFINEAKCGSNRNGKLVIALSDRAQDNTRCDFYNGSAAPTTMNLKFKQINKVIAAHEIGHALGFYHEFSRNDWVATPGHLGAECTTNADCVNVAGDYGPICTAVVVAGQPKKRCTMAANTGIKLSANADFDSMMAATYTLNNLADQTGNLSPLDISGVQAVYGVKPELTWSAWQSLGESSTLPVGAAGFGGAMHLFAVESGGVIGHNATADGSPWAAWTHELNGTTNAAIGAAGFAGNLHLFAKGGTDGRIYHRWAAQGQAFGAWSAELSGTTNVPLTAAGHGNFLHLFRVDTNNNLMHCSAPSGQAFGAWGQLDGTTNTAVAATSLGNNLHVFSRGIGNKHTYHRSSQDGQTFSAWEDMGGETNVAPATVTVPAGATGGNDRILMLVIGTDNRVYYRLAQDGFGFGNWLEIPGGATTSVAVGAARLGSNAYVFATGTDGQVRVSKANL